MTTTTRDDADLAVLDSFETIYKTQQGAISRRLLGHKTATVRAMVYLTPEEMEAVKGLSKTIGLNVSTLIRLTLITLTAASLPADYDPRVG